MPYSLASLRTITIRQPGLDRRHRRRAGRRPARAPPAARPRARARATSAASSRPRPAEQGRIGLEAVLVEVVAAAPARAQHEVALEVRALHQPAAELGRAGAAHPASASRSRAIGSRPVGVGRARRERQHRAVVEVQVDAGAVARAAAAVEDRAGERAGAEQRAEPELRLGIATLLRGSLGRRRILGGCRRAGATASPSSRRAGAAASSGRRRRARRSDRRPVVATAIRSPSSTTKTLPSGVAACSWASASRPRSPRTESAPSTRSRARPPRRSA